MNGVGAVLLTPAHQHPTGVALHPDRHVRSMRLRYRRRRDQLVATLAQRAPGIRVTGLAARLQAVLQLPRGTEASVVQEAARQGLAASGIAEFRHEVAGSSWRLPEQDALVVNYAAPSGSAWTGTPDTLCRVMP
jgi:GntR family transcriptional regulator / MocR family aminotransferase